MSILILLIASLSSAVVIAGGSKLITATSTNTFYEYQISEVLHRA